MFGVTAFFMLLPFAYVGQVLTGRPEAAVVAYLPLFAAALAWAMSSGNIRLFFSEALKYPYDWVGLGILFLTIHTATTSMAELVLGEPKYGIRGALSYLLPLAIVPLIQRADERFIYRLLKVIAIVGTIVAVEATYENIYVYILHDTTRFQLLNFAYVKSVSGLELSRFYATNYRPTGLLEHIHATVFGIGICGIAWLALYFAEERRYQLLLFAFCSAVFALHGARLALVALTIGVIVFIYSQYRLDRDSLRKVKVAGLIFVLTLCIALLIDPFGSAKMYYWPAIFHNDFQIANDGTVISVFQDELSRINDESPAGKGLGMLMDLFDVRLTSIEGPEFLEIILQSMFGFGVVNALKGVGGTTDDAFFMQIFGQYGLLGSIVFFAMWASAIYYCYRQLGRFAPLQRPLAGFALAVLVVLLLSISHSPSLQRKAIYPLFILAIAIVYRFRSSKGAGATVTPT